MPISGAQKPKVGSYILYSEMASGDQFRYTSPIPRGSAEGDNSVTFKAQHAGAKWCQFQWPHDRRVETMKNTTPTPIRIRRFITDRYAYRARPDYLSELITFGVLVLTVFWSMFVLASAMAGTLKWAQIGEKEFYELIDYSSFSYVASPGRSVAEVAAASWLEWFSK